MSPKPLPLNANVGPVARDPDVSGDRGNQASAIEQGVEGWDKGDACKQRIRNGMNEHVRNAEARVRR